MTYSQISIFDWYHNSVLQILIGIKCMGRFIDAMHSLIYQTNNGFNKEHSFVTKLILAPRGIPK